MITSCAGLIGMTLSDICSHPMLYDKDIPVPLATHGTPHVFLVAAPNGTAPNAWVYIEVFDFPQWIIFVSIMIVNAIVWSVLQTPTMAGKHSM